MITDCMSVAVLCTPINTHCKLHRIYGHLSQVYCQPTIESICYNLPLHTHDEDLFHHPQILKLVSGTHTELILNRDKNYNKKLKKLLQRQNINSQINSRFTPAKNLKVVTYVLIPNFTTQKGISKKNTTTPRRTVSNN